MITTVKANFRKKDPSCRGNITTPDFDYFVVQEQPDNSEARRRYRELLRYGCLQVLTPAEQDVIRWHYQKGCTLTEISRQTGVPISTLSHRLSAARGKLFSFAQQAQKVHEILAGRCRESESAPSRLLHS